MNFSLEIYRSKKIDVYSFFPSKNAIHCPEELWLECFLSSLKRKHQILILEEQRQDWPLWDSFLRWQVGDNWMWLSTRSFSTLYDLYLSQPKNFAHFKSQLRSSK